jgi:Plant protein of unknown function
VYNITRLPPSFRISPDFTRILTPPFQFSWISCYSISGVPDCIKKNNRELYEPEMVSIGSYHHDHEEMRALEVEIQIIQYVDYSLDGLLIITTLIGSHIWAVFPVVWVELEQAL